MNQGMTISLRLWHFQKAIHNLQMNPRSITQSSNLIFAWDVIQSLGNMSKGYATGFFFVNWQYHLKRARGWQQKRSHIKPAWQLCALKIKVVNLTKISINLLILVKSNLLLFEKNTEIGQISQLLKLFCNHTINSNWQCHVSNQYVYIFDFKIPLLSIICKRSRNSVYFPVDGDEDELRFCIICISFTGISCWKFTGLLSTGSGRHSDAAHEIRLIGCCVLLKVVPKNVPSSGSSQMLSVDWHRWKRCIYYWFYAHICPLHLG